MRPACYLGRIYTAFSSVLSFTGFLKLSQFQAHHVRSNPVRCATDLADLSKSLPYANHSSPDHSWIRCYCLVHQPLGFGRGVKAHDEMVPRVVFKSMALNGFGKEVWTPVGDAPNNAAGSKYDGASCTGNPKRY